MTKTIFGYTEDEIKALWEVPKEPKDTNCPINKGETVDACIRGGAKILADENLKNLMREIYRCPKTGMDVEE